MVQNIVVIKLRTKTSQQTYKDRKQKGTWWMPRLYEAMKDVISCDKLRSGANNRY